MAFGALITALACAAATGNFVLNGGFEETDGAAPYQWQVFVAPMPGAEAALETGKAFEGMYSVRLHVPAAYAREPYNNWSQNVMQPLAGERMELRAAIRTESATRAEVWLQCFSRSPLRELARFSTGDGTPLYGTKDWTVVAMTVTIPAATDFLTVRCVLTGAGTAWFDGIALTKHAPAPLEGIELVLIEPPHSLAKLDEENLAFVEELLKANKVLLDTVRELRESNRGLARELSNLQEHLHAIREDVATMRTQAGVIAEEAPLTAAELRRALEPRRPVPPLVPLDHELATRRPER